MMIMITVKIPRSIMLITTLIVLFCIIAGTDEVFADKYYDSKTIYTEGIYIADGLYVEPCFEHFKVPEQEFKSLKVSGDVPDGILYRLHVQTGPDQTESKWTKQIPEISGIGVYRVDVKIPGKKPVIFQAEIVLEGILPCSFISEVTYDAEGKRHFKTASAYTLVSEPRRESYNINRSGEIGEIPDDYSIILHRFADHSQIHETVPKIMKPRTHFIKADISGGPLDNQVEGLNIGMQVYKSDCEFATEEEMYENRETFGK